MPAKPEIVLCAAVHYDDGHKYQGQPRNIKSGVVICGWRHGNCIHTLFGLMSTRQVKSENSRQGFLTSRNRFISRMSAFKLAKKVGQIPQTLKTGALLSEDLY